MTTCTHDDQGPLVRRVERDLEHLGVLLLMLVEVPNVPPGETNKTRLRSITEDRTFLEWNVRPVELDTRVKGCDVHGLAHARCVNRE